MNLVNIKGNTYFMETTKTDMTIPIYKINDTDIIMIDSGYCKYDLEEIESFILQNNLTVKCIISTHEHYDHVGCNKVFQEKYGTLIAMPLLEGVLCHSINNLRTLHYLIPYSQVEKNYGDEVCTPDIYIYENDDSIDVCGIHFKIIPLYGHSSTHIGVVTPDDVIYLGDSVLGYDVIDSAKLPYEFNLTIDLETKKKICDMEYSYYVLAHKGVLSKIREIAEYNINAIYDRANMLLKIIDNDMILEEIISKFAVTYNVKIRNRFAYSEFFEIINTYLQFLEDNNKITTYIDENRFLRYRTIDKEL